MGLREKVALAAVAVITAQIICSHCMPRGLPNRSIKRHISNLISPKSDRIREFKTNRKLKKNSFNNIVTGNLSKVLNVPNVEDSTDFEAGGYYRFFCEYPQEASQFSNNLPQTRNFKREAKQKRYLDMAPKDKAELPTMRSGVARDALPQPYCFRKSDFFPEVEYPLSARDMWIPKYWSQLLDAEVPRNVKIDAPISQTPQKHTKSNYSSYENSPLYNIIKTLNTHNNADEDRRIDTNHLEEIVPKKCEDESTHVISPNNNLKTTSTTVFLEHTTPKTPDIDSEVLSYKPTTTEVYPFLETTKASSVTSPVTSAITMASVNKNLSTLPYTTTPVITNIATTISSVASSNLGNSDFDVIDVTTNLPFEDLTSPMPHSITSTDNSISYEEEKKSPNTLSTTITSIQAQEIETYLSETKVEPTTGSQPLSFISSTQNIPEQELKDYTTPMTYTTLSWMISSDFDIIDDMTTSSFDRFTSPMTHSEVTTVISTTNHEEQHLSETNTKSTISSLQSLSSTVGNKPEQELRDYSTPKISTDDIIDSNTFSRDGSDLLGNETSTSVPSKILQENANDLDTNESLLKHEVLKNDVNIKPSSIPRSSVDAPSDHSFQTKDISLSADQILPENPVEMENSQHRVMRDSFQNSLNEGILQLYTNSSSNSSIIVIDDCKENWVFSPNDSYIIWESVPEYCANIYSADNNTDNDLILYVESINSTSDNVYAGGDEAWASYTEIPYESLVFNLEDANNTWSANSNNYVIYQHMLPEDSDDTTFLFLDKEKTAGLLNDIILNTN